MNEAKVSAYRLLLAQSVLHLKWDLACVIDGLSWAKPTRIPRQLRAVRHAALRAWAFHNLAIESAHDFEALSEERFWADVEAFERDCPEARSGYREIFDRALRDELVDIFE